MNTEDAPTGRVGAVRGRQIFACVAIARSELSSSGIEDVYE